MYSQSELKISDFVCHDRFELGSYLSCMFQQFYGSVPKRPEDETVKQSLNHKVTERLKS